MKEKTNERAKKERNVFRERNLRQSKNAIKANRMIK